MCRVNLLEVVGTKSPHPHTLPHPTHLILYKGDVLLGQGDDEEREDAHNYCDIQTTGPLHQDV